VPCLDKSNDTQLCLCCYVPWYNLRLVEGINSVTKTYGTIRLMVCIFGSKCVTSIQITELENNDLIQSASRKHAINFIRVISHFPTASEHRPTFPYESFKDLGDTLKRGSRIFFDRGH